MEIDSLAWEKSNQGHKYNTFTQYKSNNLIKHIYIYTSVYGYNIAKYLLHYLTMNQISCSLHTNTLIHDKIDSSLDDEYFFIFFPHNLEIQIPKNKVFFYQLEQINSDNKYKRIINNNLINNIENSIITFDYSKENINYYSKKINAKISYLPPPCNHIISSNGDKEYDILFYGTLNQRRKDILNYLKQYYNVHVIYNIFGQELDNYIKKSKIILNIHYFDNPILETLRIHQAICHNVHIISEGKTLLNSELYNSCVHFIDYIRDDLSNISILMDDIQFLLKRKYIINNTELISKLNHDFNNGIQKLFILKYPYLFHKYILNIHCFNKPPIYEIDKQVPLNNSQICHIHCFNINQFNNIFYSYYNNIKQYYSIIITYSKGKVKNINNATILKIPNIGMDIGAKLIAIYYLNEKNIYYDNILFIHSKNNAELRKKYLDPLAISDKKVQYNQKLSYTHAAIFPNDLELNGDYNLGYFTSNNLYLNEFLSFLNIPLYTTKFIQGNCMIFNKKMIDIVFNNNLILLYNILNTENSFDYNYIHYLYNLETMEIHESYEFYKTNKISPNHIYARKTSNKLFQDGAIEHIFERCYLNILIHLKLSYLQVSSSIKPLSVKKKKIQIFGDQYENESTHLLFHNANCIYCRNNIYKNYVIYQPEKHISSKFLDKFNKIPLRIDKITQLKNNKKIYCSKYILIVTNPKILKILLKNNNLKLNVIINIKNPIKESIQSVFKLNKNITLCDAKTYYEDTFYNILNKFNIWFNNTIQLFGNNFFIDDTLVHIKSDDKDDSIEHLLIKHNIIEPCTKNEVYCVKKSTPNTRYIDFKKNFNLSESHKMLLINSSYMKYFYKSKDIILNNII